MTPTRNGAPWVFCAKCGKKMVWVLIDKTGFDRVTGEEGPLWAWSCDQFRPNEASSSHDRSNRAVHRPDDEAIAQ